eukprot:GILK01011247.1.p1 GENE.GILK01011247.1~~GILK01011247.1.p1  ORF type:complete len:319 (+),score=43.40 GILK01011247.1:112-957(+)
MYKFSANQVSLAEYSKDLTLFLRQKVQPVSALESDIFLRESEGGDLEVGKVSVSFSIHHSEEVEGVNACTCICMELNVEQASEGKPSAQLLCVLVSASSVSTKDFAHYPLVLIRGKAALAANFRDWLQMRFDCHVSRVRLSPFEVSHLTAQWLQHHHTQGAVCVHPLELTYGLPSSVPDLRQIVITVTAGDLDTILDRIGTTSMKDSQQTGSLIDGSPLFELVQQHVLANTHLVLSGMNLTRAACDVAMLAAEGKVKVLAVGQLSIVLKNLCKIALQTSPI